MKYAVELGLGDRIYTKFFKIGSGIQSFSVGRICRQTGSVVIT
jgi:hypothetical protein